MSHFSVLVIGPDIDAQMAPFHEFECTGVDDQYVQEIDITADTRERYDTETTVRMKELATGVLHNRFTPEGAWDERFSRPAQDLDELMQKLDPHRREEFVPEGFERVELPIAQVLTFAEYVTVYLGTDAIAVGASPDLRGDHKFGYAVRDEAGEVVKVIDRTNPNKRWDWYQLGGRWKGYFKLRPGATGVLGESGVGDNEADPGTADQCTKGDVDVIAMRAEAARRAGEQWDAFHAVYDLHPIPVPWAAWRDQALVEKTMTIERAREGYHSQPAIKALQEARLLPWDTDTFTALVAPRDTYTRSRAETALVPYAVVKESTWYARGEMGWFGIARDEKDIDAWTADFNKLWAELPADTLVSCVDCHI